MKGVWNLGIIFAILLMPIAMSLDKLYYWLPLGIIVLKISTIISDWEYKKAWTKLITNEFVQAKVSESQRGKGK